MKAIKSIQGRDPGNKITVIASNVIVACSFFQRLLGLLALRPLEGSEGLLIKDCKSIHTIGMRYNIDAVFIDSGGRVAAIFEDMAPFRFSPYIREACSVLELRAGAAVRASIRIGDIIDFVE